MKMVKVFCGVAIILCIVISIGYQAGNPDAKVEQGDVSAGAEPLEGTMYEPSGLHSNPARPQSSNPASH